LNLYLLRMEIHRHRNPCFLYLIKKLFLVWITLLFLPFNEADADGWLDDFRTAGYIKQESAIRISGNSLLTKLRSTGYFSLRYRFGSDVHLVIGNRIILEPVNKFEHIKDFDASPLDKWEYKNSGEWDLRECYLELTYPFYRMRIGRQQVKWGSAEGLRVLDVVNPMDYREFILDEISEAKIPLWMINFTYDLGNYHIQSIWIPDFEPDRTAAGGTEFYGIPAYPSVFYPHTISLENSPSDGLKRADYGFALSRPFRNWLFSLHYWNGRNKLPTFFYLESNGIISHFERNESFGWTFTWNMVKVIYYGEFLYTKKKSMYKKSSVLYVDVEKKDQLYYMLGFDCRIGKTPFVKDISMRFFQRLIREYESILIDDEAWNTLSFALKTDFWYDLCHADVAGFYTLNTDDSWIRFSFRYDYMHSLKFMGGFDLFSGSYDGIWGQFCRRDRIHIGFIWKF